MTEEERKEIEQEIIEEFGKKEPERIMNSETVIDTLQEDADARRDRPFTGEVVFGAPGEMEMILDFTGLRGSGSNIYHFFIYQAPKWRYAVKKVDDFLFVSPVWADYYNLTISQKQKLEGAIKTGLASATQAVADYELVKHDARRYREILDYFVIAEKTGDEHVLRSMFVDRVDAYTGENYSMISMTTRWPTIITDFIRMKSDWNDIETIRKELDVSQAEATVLKTKNELFKEWKNLFLPTIKERYARIESLARARKKSIDEYRKWLKPYIAKFKAMKESDEKNPAAWITDAYVTPGFGQTEALVGSRLWLWKSFSIVEMGKPPARLEMGNGKWEIYPYDDWVKRWKKKIEYKYNLVIDDNDVEAILEEATSKKGIQMEVQQMYPEDLYYILFDMQWLLSLLKTPPPEGIETDNLMIFPVRTWIMSQNALLLHIIELKAREKFIENEINEIIGAKEIEEDIFKKVETEFEKEKPDKFTKWKSFVYGTKRFWKKTKPWVLKFYHIFFKPGPYEPVFFERVSKMYFRASGQYYGQLIDYFKKQFKVE